MYDRILIPVDGSEISNRAAGEGLKLAGILGSSVTLLYVIDISIITIPDAETAIANAEAIRQSFKAQGESVLESLKAQAGKNGVTAETMISEGDVHNEIVGVADRIKAGLIVMGSHGRRGLNRLVLGSVAESVARRAHCPVLLVRPELSE